MLKNYLTTAFRIMLRQKAYSFINIVGLGLGIAASLLIILYVVDEISFDRFHKDYHRTYRLGFKGRLQGNDFDMAVSPAPVAEAMQSEIPEVESVVRFGLWRTMPMSFDDKSFTERYMLVADSNFFEFFSFPLVKGDPKTVLKGMNKLVVTESAAKRYFGDENPIGKILLRGSEKTACEITGVAKDAPGNSSIVFDVVLSSQSWQYMRDTHWTSNNIYTYVKVNPQATVDPIKKKLDVMAEKNMGHELEELLGLTFKQFREQGNDVGLNLNALEDLHLRVNQREEILPAGNLQYLYIFGAVAVFIIIIGCINFMNLSTARSANRAKEVGVRKTIGALRSKLMSQFLAESLIYSALSMMLAMLIIAAVLAPFNVLSGKTLTLALFAKPMVVVGLILFTAVVGLLAGSYPAFYLTSFRPSEVLKGRVRSGFKNSVMRNALVTFQFVISIALILGSIVVYKQLMFMQEKNMGFQKENVIDLLHTWSLDKNAKAFKNELAQHPEFKGASFSSSLPPHIGWSNAFRKGGTEQDFLLQVYHVDHDHLATMQYEMVDGRFFSRDFASDTAAVILNESAYRQMGFDKLENQTITDFSGDKPHPLKIIGVMKNFNFESLRNDVKPMAILLGGEPNGEMAIRLAPGNTREQLKLLETIWKKYSTNAFEYSFIDENFDALFRSEQRMSYIVLIFTVLAITIASLGLFGLTTFTAEQRAKEISIRKVMGASVPHIMMLMSKDFAVLIVIAFAIAAPLGWYLASSWLDGFAYHTGVDAWAVVLAGLASLITAVITISFQSLKAARANPVDAMRSE
ncbi:ABC transporter permease [Chryseolinea lacunae]|uniref:ABC transporter permease n=1 Tax=Chryseolinea lacunae TaxID=2801331 RepID=A0ABS1KRR2_9BACT|nr:ABC transporter permease [Chryseolinea lacunae]MBL0742054.1 ABC transporter permease [Chryseolinea lacunae]